MNDEGAVGRARDAEWAALAARLGLEEAGERAGKLRRFLDLPSEVALEPLFRTRLEVVPQALAATLPSGRAAVLYLFDYALRRTGPAGEVAQLCSVALLAVPHRLSSVAVKALPKQHRVLERLTASATGSATVPFDDAGFGERVTVYARDEAGARALLGLAVRQVLVRTFAERGVAPSLLIGERQLLLSVTASAAAPTPLAALEHLVTDLLSLYGLLATRVQPP